MAVNYETGHVKNVANFEAMISFCTAYGAAYNPSKESLSLEALNSLLTQARTALADITEAKNQLDLVINDRQIKFSPLKSEATRIIDALKASEVSAQTTADAASINKKLQGGRATPKPKEGEAAKTISTSQQSFDNRLDSFMRLVNLVASEPGYKPNEKNLKVETLTAFAEKLQMANTAVINANTIRSNKMIERNDLLYAPETGLVVIAFGVKAYIRSLFGSTSPQYKQVSGLKFTRKR